jgi:arylsulfatase A-like enzyme/uncharacterized membrane protein YbhN (UPF0104 family)
MAKKLAFFAFKLVFIASLFVLIFRPETFGFSEDLFNNISVGSLWEKLKALSPWQAAFWLSFAAGIKLCGIFAGIVRWRILLRAQGIHIPFWYLIRCYFWGRAIGLYLPGTLGLDGYRLVESSAYTGEVIKCTTVIAVEKLTGIIALFTIVFLTLPLGFGLLPFKPALLGVVLLIIGGFVTFTMTLLLQPRIIQVLVTIIPTPAFIRNKVQELGAAVTAYGSHRWALLKALACAFCVHLGICLMYFGTMSAVDTQNVGFFDILFASPLIIVGSVLAPTVSGMGVREVVMTKVFGTSEAAAAEAFIFGHLGLWFGEVVPFVISLPLLLFTQRPKRDDMLAEAKAVREAAAKAGEKGDWLHLSPERIAEYRGKVWSSVFAGLAGGLIAGALVGLSEAGWLVYKLEGLSEVSAYTWGPIVYGILFAGLGLGISAGLTYLYLLFDRFAPTAITFGLAAGGTLAAAVMIIGRFRYQRDVLGEAALTTGQNGLLLGTAIALAVAAIVVGGVLGMLARRSWKRGAIGTAVLYLAIIVAGVAAGSLAAPKGDAAPAFTPTTGAGGPNVVFIAIDTLRADYLNAFTDKAVTTTTPNIDALVGESVAFTRCFAQSSWTKPSFATLFTGRYPESHRATGKASMLPDESITTVTEALQASGYYTQGFPNNPNISPVFGFGQGFVDYHYLSPSLHFGAKYSASKLVLYEVLRKVREKVNARLRGGSMDVGEHYQPADVVTDTALDWLDSGARPEGAPFYLFTHYMDPHDPFMDPDQPGVGYARAGMEHPDPEVYLAKFKHAYSGEIDYMDQHIGRLVAGLKERGLFDDSLIVFTSDHGEEFFEHEGWWHGLSLYDEVIYVPLSFKLPGNQLAGKVNPGLARHVDVAPTLLALIGAQSAEGMQGQSLFTDDLQPANQNITEIYAELNFDQIELQSVRTADEKLIRSLTPENKRGLAPVELYNLIDDLGEQVNLAGQTELKLQEQQLQGYLDGMQDFIRAGAAEPTLLEGEMDEDLQEQLGGLGYLGE